MAKRGRQRTEPKFDEGGVSLSELHHLLARLIAFTKLPLRLLRRVFVVT